MALSNNRDSLGPFLDAEGQQREDYFVLNRRALDFEQALSQQIQQDALPERFSLLKMNHTFEHSVGDECHYRAPEMTLAFKRVACPCDHDATTSASGNSSRWTLRWGALLLCVLYAALHLWRLLAH